MSGERESNSLLILPLLPVEVIPLQFHVRMLTISYCSRGNVRFGDWIWSSFGGAFMFLIIPDCDEFHRGGWSSGFPLFRRRGFLDIFFNFWEAGGGKNLLSRGCCHEDLCLSDGISVTLLVVSSSLLIFLGKKGLLLLRMIFTFISSRVRSITFLFSNTLGLVLKMYMNLINSLWVWCEVARGLTSKPRKLCY